MSFVHNDFCFTIYSYLGLVSQKAINANQELNVNPCFVTSSGFVQYESGPTSNENMNQTKIPEMQIDES